MALFSGPPRLGVVLLLVICAVGQLAAALDFEMQAQTKCLFEEINANVIVVGDYKSVNKDSPTVPIYIDVKVWCPACSLDWGRSQQAGGVLDSNCCAVMLPPGHGPSWPDNP
jgi:hypothetical protein